MRLILKHIFRSFADNPLQPLMMVLTAALAVAVGTTAICMADIFTRRTFALDEGNRSRGDIVIELGQDSRERMIFCDDVEAVAGEGCEIFGDFGLTVLYGTKSGKVPLSVRAADMEAADRYFKFDFLQYGSFTEDKLAKSAVISRTVAEKQGLCVGDELVMSVLGREVTYTVEAVAWDEYYFKDCDILIDIGGAVKLLGEISPAIAGLGDSFSPCTRIMIKAGEGVDIGELYSRISESRAFSDDRVQRPDSSSLKDLKLISQGIAVLILSMLVLMLCVIVMTTAMSFLILQRESEYALFEASGATPWRMYTVMISESVIYASVGIAAGLFAVPHLLEGGMSFFSWYEGNARLSPVFAVIGSVIVLIIAVGSAVICGVNRSKRTLTEIISVGGYTDRRKKESLAMPIISISAVAATQLISLCLPVSARYIVQAVSLVSFVVFVYYASTRIISFVCKGIERITRGLDGVVLLKLAAKNIKGGYMQRHTGRLLSLLFALLLTISLAANTAERQEELFDKIFEGELLTLGMSTDLRERLEADPNIEGVADFQYYPSAEINGEYSVIAVAGSGDAEACFYDEALPKKLPPKGYVSISKGIARLCDLREGDELEFSLDGREQTLIVSEVQDTELNFVFVSPETVGSRDSFTVIALGEKADKEDIITLLDADGTGIIDVSDIDISGVYTLRGFLSLARATLVISVVVALLGFVNLLCRQIRTRKRERELFSLSGMTRAGVAWLWVTELLLLLTVAALIAAVGGAAMYLMLNEIAASFGLSFI